jgi:RHS repeat-associated protein
LIEKEAASGEVKAKQDWQYDAAGNQTGSTTQQRTLTTPAVRTKVETRAVTGRNQLTGLTATPGSSLIEGTVNEISNVTVNGQTAPLAFSAAAPYGFQKELNLPPGDQVITIQSTDGSANSAQKSYTLTVRGDYALAYDVNGNLLTKTWRQTGSPGVDWVKETYAWDKENRLTGWTKERLLVTGVQTAAVLASATWTYDGLGRRVKEQNVAGAAVTDTHFVWDGMAMVQWQSATGVAQRNLFDEGEHNIATMEKLIYVKDHLGSVRGWHRLSDGARGEADYSAWGVRSVVSNTTGALPVRSFTGHYQHAASGLVLAAYRGYDAELGRWLSEDPIEEEGGQNLYGYVGNGVVGRVDPLGLIEWGPGMEGLRDSLNKSPAGAKMIKLIEEAEARSKGGSNLVCTVRRGLASNQKDGRVFINPQDALFGYKSEKGIHQIELEQVVVHELGHTLLEWQGLNTDLYNQECAKFGNKSEKAAIENFENKYLESKGKPARIDHTKIAIPGTTPQSLMKP